MAQLSRNKFLQNMPELLLLHLPPSLQGLKSRQQWQWLIQFHYGEPSLHYEISPVRERGWEIGFHCEAKDSRLNRFLLDGFRRHLFEIKDMLGRGVEAEMWDRGWTKIYEVVPEQPITTEYQQLIAERLVRFIICLHPIYVDLRNVVAKNYR